MRHRVTHGGEPLRDEITASGNENAALPMTAAACSPKDRGYERVEEKRRALSADIERRPD